MGGATSGLVVTPDDDNKEDSTEDNPDLDDAVAERVKEIQFGGDWRKMKALRQKKLSRQEGATVSKRHKKTTKALWRQALVTRSAEAESQSDSASSPVHPTTLLPILIVSNVPRQPQRQPTNLILPSFH